MIDIYTKGMHMEIVVIFIVVAILMRGLVKVFSEHFWLSVLMLVFLAPIFLLWVIYRGIFG